MAKLCFAAFHGKSWTSKLVRFFTRSKSFSHVAYVESEGCLIEPWPTAGNPTMKWGFTTFHDHTPGTVVELWELEVSPEIAEASDKFFRTLASNKTSYDFAGALGFAFRWTKQQPKAYFCSEGCVWPLKTFLNWSTVVPEFISPRNFVELLEAAGGVEIRRMVL